MLNSIKPVIYNLARTPKYVKRRFSHITKRANFYINISKNSNNDFITLHNSPDCCNFVAV